MKPYAIVHDNGLCLSLTLWWGAGGRIEGEFSVRDLGEGE